MKKILFAGALVVFLSACQSNTSSDKTGTSDGIHSAVVKEVLQTNDYTFMQVKTEDAESWLALPKMQASVGETYYYKAGLPMKDFESKELNRTFKEILFLDNISTSPEIAMKSNSPAPSSPSMSPAGTMQGNPESVAPAVAHTVVAAEVLQTSQYTYIRAKEGNTEFWLAVAKMDATVGITYYFEGGLLMTDFASKELKRTFKEILFVDKIFTDAITESKNNSEGSDNATIASKGSAIDLEKKEIKLKHAKDDITIATLIENKKAYSGKTVRLKGQVTKFSPGILKRNWIHLQDGTDFSGKFDLTVTTDQEVKIGDNITVEGTITLDKDFGFGYFYELIMEDARLIK